MQKKISYLLFLTMPLILNAQWVQTNLNSDIGYSLFSNDTSIYAGSSNGVYYTNDVGDPWFSIGPDDWIFSLITDGNNLIAGSGSSKGIWISSNLGQSWSQASGIDSISVNTLTKNDNYIFAGSWGGGVFRSENNGSSWQKIGLDGEPVEAIYTLGNTVFAGGNEKVYFSSDNGNTWDFRNLPYPATRVYCFAERSGKIFAGTDGGLYSSTDSGNTWLLEYGATFDPYGNVTDTKMFKALIVHDEYLIASIMFNSIWISSDDGKQWSSFNDGLISDWTFYGLAKKDSDLWALTEVFGNAYRRPLADLTTDIKYSAPETPTEFVLYQNYPNPFNPNTTVRYSLPQSGFVSLKVYDMLGNEVANLVDKEEPRGNYNLEFDASSLTSGVYFYRLECGNFTETKKLILLR